MKVVWKETETEKVFAAIMGLVVAQRTETKDKIARMTSRFHRGQFYRKLSEKLPISHA